MKRSLDIELAEVRPKVLALARRFFRASGLAGDPEDVVQDVLVRLWEVRQSGKEIRNVEAWAVATARNCCVSLWRKSRKGFTLPLREEEMAGYTPTGSMEEKEAMETVKKALESIPAATRLLLQLRAKGLSLDEMAAVTGRPKGSLKSSISAARKQMLKLINPE